MKAKGPIIVIGRAFGAGGRKIGRLLADRLGIPLYDNELLKEAAGEFGYSSEIFARADERRPSAIKRWLSQSYGVPEIFNPEALSSETLYQLQSRVIQKIADKGPCVILGRTADYILRDRPELTSIFLHAPISCRAANIMARGDASSREEAIQLAQQRDREREDYYNYFTGRTWGHASNYDLTLNPSLLKPEETVELICAYLNIRTGKKAFGIEETGHTGSPAD